MLLSKPLVAVVAAVVLALSPLALAQPVAPAQPIKPPPPPAGDVMKHIPAGCLGFLVVNNVQDFAGKVDEFIRQISPPSNPLIPGSVLDMVRAGAQLGDTFNPNGGFAAVMLDPQQFGFDLAGMISGGPAASEKAPEVPLVLIVPGTDPAKLMAAYKPAADGAYTKVGREGRPPMYCKTTDDGYILLSPSKKALDAAMTAKGVGEAMAAGHKELLVRDGLALWLDFKVLGPTLDAILAKAQKDLAASRPAGGMEEMPAMPMMMAGGNWANNIANLRTMLQQVAAISIGARFVPAGAILEARVSYTADSLMAKTLAASTPVAAPLLNRLPNMPYVLAIGAKGKPKMSDQDRAAQIDMALATEPFASLAPEIKAKLKPIFTGLNEQVQGTQVYLGGLTSGSGLVGLAVVLECKAPEEMRKLLADGVAVAGEILATAKDPNLKKLTVKYVREQEQVGDKKADAIQIDHPELAQMSEANRAMLKGVLGEDKLRVLVAPGDDNTLVLTLGGGTAFLADALKAAGGSGTLANDANVTKALAALPKERLAVVVLNAANGVTLVQKVVMAAMGMGGENAPPMPAAAATPPFAGAVTVDKGDLSLVGFLPMETIRELIKLAAPAGGGGGPIPAPPEE